MDQLYYGQSYLFILSTTTLFTDIQSMGDHSINWFDAQEQCSDHGLTIEKNQRNQPYWTGVYRRLTPWINIIGCYNSEFIESLPDVVGKTLVRSSIGLCQEMCFHEIGYKFALKMNICLCIRRNISFRSIVGLSPSNCTYRCDDYSDDKYLRDCGGESAYNIYEIQGEEFKTSKSLDPECQSVDTCLCLSLQCPKLDPRFIPHICSKSFGKICGNDVIPNGGYQTSWISSMEKCRELQPSTYLWGDFDLNNPHLVCEHITQFVWVGVARQMYTSIDQGWEIKEAQRETFLWCQMCKGDDCSFKRCTDLLASSIFCKNISVTSQSQITENLTTLHGSFLPSTYASNHLTSNQLLLSTPTAGTVERDQLPSINDTFQISDASDELALKVSLPITVVFISSVLCATLALVFYTRRKNVTKTEKTTKEEVDSVRKTTVHSESNYIQDNSYFKLEQCSQKISTGNDSVNESPYNESKEGVYDHLRYKQARKPEVEDTYQHASAGVSTDLSEYDTMANAHNRYQEEVSSYDYSHTDKNENYRTDLRAKNHLTDSPYDVAV